MSSTKPRVNIKLFRQCMLKFVLNGVCNFKSSQANISFAKETEFIRHKQKNFELTSNF
jgi:hypothetical protein